MSDEEEPKSFEEQLRAIADEVSRGLQSFKTDDLEEWRAVRRRRRPRQAVLRQRRRLAARPGREPGRQPVPGPRRVVSRERHPAARAGTTTLRGAGPDPLDLPTDDQGRALAALDSGRWTVEPGTSRLTSTGDGPGPRDALGLTLELRVRDWLDADGDLTLAGRAALKRWLDD